MNACVKKKHIIIIMTNILRELNEYMHRAEWDMQTKNDHCKQESIINPNSISVVVS